MNNVKIIIVSNLCSDKVFEKIFHDSKLRLGYSIQKYLSLLTEGFSKQVFSISSFSTLSISNKTTERTIINYENDCDHGVNFYYCPTINIFILKNLFDFLFIFFKILFIKKTGNLYIICDALNTSSSSAALFASKLRRIKIIGLLTDMPQFNGFNDSLKRKIAGFFSFKMLKNYSAYIFLTNQMNKKINLNNKPFIIIEGMADFNLFKIENKIENKFKEKVIIYAGGLHEKYGIKMLIDAFMQITNKDIRLYLFGEGPLIEYINAKTKVDNRICFFGTILNEEIVSTLQKATLSINPRFTGKEYTKYSFPGKNIEYMASGTPFACTLLPGIPSEYFPFMYLIKDESTEGLKNVIEQIITMDKLDLHSFGNASKHFILENKSNVVQSKKIIDFMVGLQ